MTHYYNPNVRAFLALSEGVSLAEWQENPNHPAAFAIHPDGFCVFLRSDEIAKLDEYVQGDPYAVAEKLDKPFHQHRLGLTIEMVTQAAQHKTETLKILDVACGEGHISAAVRDVFPTAEIFAFDGSLSAIQKAHYRYKGISFAVADAYAPPYAPHFFDCIICNNIWEHVPDPLRLLDGITSLLKPNGHLIVSTPSRYRLNNLLRVLAGKPVAFASEHHVTEYSVGQVIEQLRYADFDVEKITCKLLWPDRLTFRSLIKCSIGLLLTCLLRLNRSQHVLGPTAFYLARKRDKGNKGSACG